MQLKVNCLVVVTVLLSSCAVAVGPMGDDTIRQQADNIVNAFYDASAFQGVVLLAADGEVVYARAVGAADIGFGVPNDLTTRFQIASVSKPFTATAVLQLVERGQLSLDAPLSGILPSYPNGEKLTLDHLLTHTSGIPNVNGFDNYDDWSKNNHEPAGLVELFKNEPLEFEPGERYDYSNSNYNLLAYVIEIVSGQSYGDFLTENIFEPLGMTDTGHRDDPGTIVSRLARGYVAQGARGVAQAPYLDWSIKTGNGSLYSTVYDLLKFDQALRAGKLLRPKTIDAAYGFDRELGSGWFAGERYGARKVHMSGRSPGYTAYFERYVDSDRTMIILSNLYISPPPPMLNALASVLLGLEPDLDTFGGDITSVEFGQFTGTYKFGEDWFVGSIEASLEERTDHLVLRYVDGPAPEYEMILVPLGGVRFFDRTHGGLVRFEMAADGSAPVLVYEYGSEWRAMQLAR